MIFFVSSVHPRTSCLMTYYSGGMEGRDTREKDRETTPLPLVLLGADYTA